MYTSSDTRLEWPGDHYSSRTQINAGGQNGATINYTTFAILKKYFYPVARDH